MSHQSTLTRTGFPGDPGQHLQDFPNDAPQETGDPRTEAQHAAQLTGRGGCGAHRQLYPPLGCEGFPSKETSIHLSRWRRHLLSPQTLTIGDSGKCGKGSGWENPFTAPREVEPHPLGLGLDWRWRTAH